MMLIIAAVLAVAWLLGLSLFHVASGAIHVLLVLAIVGVIAHFVRGLGGNRSPIGRLG